MTYAAHLVVRKKHDRYYAGFASEYPLNHGYKHVKSFGSWYGSQMDFEPFKKAMKEAKEYAKKLNGGIDKPTVVIWDKK